MADGPRRLREGDIVKLPIRAINRSKEIWGEDAEEFRFVDTTYSGYPLPRLHPHSHE